MSHYLVQFLRQIPVGCDTLEFKRNYIFQAENADQAEKLALKNILEDFDLFNDKPEYIENLYTLLLMKQHGSENLAEEIEEFESDLALFKENPEDYEGEAEPKIKDYIEIYDSNVNYDFIHKYWSDIDLDDVPFDQDSDKIVIVFNGEDDSSLGWIGSIKAINEQEKALLESLDILE